MLTNHQNISPLNEKQPESIASWLLNRDVNLWEPMHGSIKASDFRLYEPFAALVEQIPFLSVYLDGVAYPAASDLVWGRTTLVEHALYAERVSVSPSYRAGLYCTLLVYVHVHRNIRLAALSIHGNTSPNKALTHDVSNAILQIGTMFPVASEV